MSKSASVDHTTSFPLLPTDLWESYFARFCIAPRDLDKLLVTIQGRRLPFALDGAGGNARPAVHMWGLSGTGKTTAINRILNAFPLAIRHTRSKSKSFQTTQLVLLKLSCPPRFDDQEDLL